MKTSFLALALAPALPLLALAAALSPRAVEACGMPETLQPGVVAGDQFVCVTEAGRLVAHDLRKGSRRYFAGARGLLSSIDAADGQVCVASRENVLVVDLASGKVRHTLRHADGPVSVGFVDGRHVYAASKQAVEVFDLETGKREHLIELRKADVTGSDLKGLASKTPAAQAKPGEGATASEAAGQRAKRGPRDIPWIRQGIVPACRQGSLLFVALPGGDRAFALSEFGCVATVDLQKGRLIDEVKVASGIVGLAVAESRLIVRSGFFSYGIPLEHCTSHAVSEGKIDVKSKDVRRCEVAMYGLEAVSPANAFVDGSDLLIAWGKKIVRVNAQGKLVAEKEALAAGRELVGVWNHQPLVAEDESLQVVALTPIEQKSAGQKPATAAAVR